jgi:hypothetical protein
MRCLCLFLAATTAAPASSAPGYISVAGVVHEIAANLTRLRAQLPDFICREKITSQSFEGKRVVRQSVIESNFTGLQSPDKEHHLAFTEIREVQTVDGKRVRKHWKLKAPYLFTGGFSSSLWSVFGPLGPNYHVYGFFGQDGMSSGKEFLVVGFKSKPGAPPLLMEDHGHVVPYTDSGIAYVDRSTYDVKLLELMVTFFAADKRPLAVSVTYHNVAIGGQSFSLPAMVRVREGDPESKATPGGLFVAEYSGYRKFTASSEIQFGP